MQRLITDASDLEALIRPETALEHRLLQAPDFRAGLLWGEPRFGHPEGKVALHVREVLDNIDLIEHLSQADRERLRLIALSHDTFKYVEDRSRPRDWNRHHGMLARRFLEPYVHDPAVLDIVETHDDAYYAWLAQRNPSFPTDQTGKSLELLMRRMDEYFQLYYLFFKCDTQTGDKTQASLKWFEREAQGIVVTPIREKSREVEEF